MYHPSRLTRLLLNVRALVHAQGSIPRSDAYSVCCARDLHACRRKRTLAVPGSNPRTARIGGQSSNSASDRKKPALTHVIADFGGMGYMPCRHHVLSGYPAEGTILGRSFVPVPFPVKESGEWLNPYRTIKGMSE